MTDVLVDTKTLHEFYVQAFRHHGVSAVDSQVCADGVQYADLTGTVTHGAVLLGRLYLTMLRDGTVDPGAVPVVVRQTGATALVDGGNGVGFVGATFAMRTAIERARRYGVGAVAVRNSSHCGCMGHYTRMAVEAGMVGIALTNLGAQGLIPPPGGRDRLLGTNVLAAAAPTGDVAPFSLDMSAAVVAAGRIRLARDRGERVPVGWLADADGRPVTDPAGYFTGAADLQFLGGGPATGGFKGYGLAVLADILCGVLSGASVGTDAAGGGAARQDANIGHFFLAVDVGAFRPAGAFQAGLDRMLGTLRGSSPARPDRSMSYPGLPEHERRAASGDAVAVPAAAVAELEALAAALSLPAPVRVGAARPARA
jgi:LDH2 family malate/lactate/ureidoglycolate dehydrogenase